MIRKFAMTTKVKYKKTQLVASHRDKLAKKCSSANRRGEPSFLEAVLSMAILAGVIALIWYLI